MSDPNSDLLAATDPEVLAAFHKAYTPMAYLGSRCIRCSAYVKSKTIHSEWHRATAQREWIQAAAILNGISIGELEPAATLTGSEQTVIVQGTKTVRTTTGAIASVG